jgi:DNA-binding CsgD family transcriptional regulator
MARTMLTTREIEVLRLIAQGCSYRVAGERLGISTQTVATHVKNLYRKLGVHCAAAAVMRAVELRLLGPGSGSGSGNGSSPGVSAPGGSTEAGAFATYGAD